MVIDPSSGYNKGGISSSAGGTTKAKATAGPPTNQPSAPAAKKSSDSVSLSSQAHKMARLEAAVKDSPEIDEARVAAVKSAVDNGTYSIDPHSIAHKMLGDL